MKRPLLLIIAVGLVFITWPAFFERLHSDEVIYWEVAKNISRGLGAVSETNGNSAFLWHMPLPFFIVAPFLKVSEHIFTARVISSFFTIGSSVLIFLICRKRHGDGEAAVSALLFLFSFQALRFGGRYYLDQYGLFFFLLSLYLIGEEKFFAAGVFSLAAVLAREYWAGVYPFLLLYLVIKDSKGFVRFVLPGLAFILISAVYVTDYWSLYGNGRFLPGASVAKNIKASISGVYLYPAARGWIEFSVLNLLIVMGFLSSVRDDKAYAVLVIPQVIVISLIHGFIIDGGVTEYPISLAGTLAVYSGPGLKRLYDRFAPMFFEKRFQVVMLPVITAQFLFFNGFATSVSLHKNIGVYGFGYSDDSRIISILRREAKGEFIHGIWGAFVDGRKKWDWTDYLVEEAIEKDPDWLITYDNYVEVLGRKDGPDGLTIYRIGPYIMIHSLHKSPLKELVRSKVFPKWKLRGG